jgi:hypothetical protein
MKVVVMVDEKKRKKMILGSVIVVVLAVLLPNTAWCIPRLGASCVNHNSCRIGAIAHISNCDNFSRNSNNNNSSTVPLPHHHSRLPLGRHSNFLPSTFHASTAGRWATLLKNATSQSKATHRELRHPWSTNKGAIRRVLHHGLATPTTPWSTNYTMLQLREDGPLCSRMPPAKAKQLTMSSGTCGQPTKGPSEGSYTTDWLRQLHHRGGDSHGRRSASGYILPQ